jgi:hypothetical protein
MTNHEFAPALPEHYKPGTILGMMPDQIIYPSSSSYVIDEHTSIIYLDTSEKINAFDAEPTYFGTDRTALMKVLISQGGKEIEGYIADLRHTKNSGIFAREITQFKKDDTDVMFDQSVPEEYTTLLGAIFYDIDGKEMYVGDPIAESHAMHLAIQLDILQEELDPYVKDEIRSRLPGSDLEADYYEDPELVEFLASSEDM